MLPLLAQGVGPAGPVVGIEHSPEMAELARRRMHSSPSSAGNVELIQLGVEEFSSAERAGALLFCYTHDVLQSSAALGRLMQHTRPGARVVVLGNQPGGGRRRSICGLAFAAGGTTRLSSASESRGGRFSPIFRS